jgi:metallophosphoesterase superfamily enzyme
MASSERRQQLAKACLRPWTSLVFAFAIRRCSYPALDPRRQHKLLILTDPQLPDYRSYASRSWLLRWLTEKVIENFARKCYDVLLHHEEPDTIVCLGDLLDSGVLAKDRLEYVRLRTAEEAQRTVRHARYAKRFKSIFPTHGIQTIYVPGNHDLGLHLPAAEAEHARDQFADEFGPLNGVLHAGNHSKPAHCSGSG